MRHGDDWSPTPTTHQPPKLVELDDDDPAVRALTLPPPLTPIDDEETPPPVANPNDPVVLKRKEQLRIIANADLAKAYAGRPGGDDEQTMGERLITLELWKIQAELDLENLRAEVKALHDQLRDEMRRRASV